MGHGEITFQVVATLTGAGVVSLLLIALINAEAKHRIANPAPEIENVNLWDLIKSKISGFTHTFMRSNRTNEKREPDPWEQNSIGSRGLKWVEERSLEEEKKETGKQEEEKRYADNSRGGRIPDGDDESPPHPVRHGHSRQHHLQLFEVQHEKSKLNRTTRPPDENGPPFQTKRDLCYSGNQVLVVIGLTCLLNFAFVLIVVACVHYLNRVGSSCVEKHMSPGSMSRYDSMESEAEEAGGGDTVSMKPLCPRCPPSHSMERLLFID